MVLQSVEIRKFWLYSTPECLRGVNARHLHYLNDVCARLKVCYLLVFMKRVCFVERKCFLPTAVHLMLKLDIFFRNYMCCE